MAVIVFGKFYAKKNESVSALREQDVSMSGAAG
jgi:hypothetical protein